MKDKLNQIMKSADELLKSIDNQKEIEEFRVKLLGKKGELTSILKQMGKLSAEERPVIGQMANDVRKRIEASIQIKMDEIKDISLKHRLEKEILDVTLPGKFHEIGHKHPLSFVLDEIQEIFLGMGFDIVEGPEIEYVYYNFDALNIDKKHPSRDLSDTFYIDEEIVLRTQTSPVQVHIMEEVKPPIRIISPGRVYRPDASDATHTPVFHQIEGLVVDKGITFSDLKGTLEVFIKRLYGSDSVVRFRPHHFPFTEPSAEVDAQCFNCQGKGCSLCKGEGWMEILGCGMVHPNVLKNCGIDPEVYSGFAFGMGLERIVMRRYGIDDLRLFFENDIRFLKQF